MPPMDMDNADEDLPPGYMAATGMPYTTQGSLTTGKNGNYKIKALWFGKNREFEENKHQKLGEISFFFE